LEKPLAARLRALADAAQAGVETTFVEMSATEPPSRFVSLQQSIRILETSASTIRCVGATLVPGILQHEGYMASIFGDHEATTAQRAGMGRWISERVARRTAALESGSRLHCVVFESALRNRVTAAMDAQLDLLVRLSESPRLDLQIVPEESLLPTAPLTNFMTLDDEVVLEDCAHGMLVHVNLPTVARFMRAHDIFAAVALNREETRNRLLALREGLQWR